MPDYLVELEDGRKFRVKSKTPLSEEEVTSYALGQQTPAAAPAADQPGRLGSFASNVGRGALSVIPGTVGGVGYALGSDTLTGAADTIEGGINRMLPVNPEYQDDLLMKGGQAVGQAIGMLGTGGAVGAAGKSLALSRGLAQGAAAAKGANLARNVMLGTGIAQGTRGGGQAAEQYGMQGGAAYARALLGGAIEGASERYLFGMGTELAPVKKFLGEAAEKGVGGIVKSVGTEAGEEAVSQIGGNVATSVLAPYGVQTPGVLEGVGESALLGGIAGGTIGGIGALMQPSPTIEGDALVPTEQAPPPVEEPEDDYGVAAFQQQMTEIAAQPDPIVPLPPPIEDVPAVIYDLRSAETGEALDLDQIELALDIAEVKLKQGKPVDWPRDRLWLPNVSTASVRSLQQLVGSQVGIDAMRSRINQLRQQEAKGSTDPIAPIQQTVTAAAENSVRVNANVLPATAAVIEAGGLAPAPTVEQPAPIVEQPRTREEEIAQMRAMLRLNLSAEEREDMEQQLAQAQAEGAAADQTAEERRQAIQREDIIRRQQDREAELQRLAEERQRATAREQQRQQPPVVEETVAPIQPVPVVEETGAPVETKGKKSKTKPKTVEQAQARIAEQQAASEFVSELRAEKAQEELRNKKGKFISDNAADNKESTFLSDLLKGGWDKSLDDVQAGRVTPQRAATLAQAAADAGLIDTFTAKRFTPEQVLNVENVIDEPGVAEVGLGMAKKAKSFKDELEMSGVAYLNGDRWGIKQSSDGTFYVEQTVNGERKIVASNFPDIEAAQGGAISAAFPSAVESTGTPVKADPTLEEGRIPRDEAPAQDNTPTDKALVKPVIRRTGSKVAGASVAGQKSAAFNALNISTLRMLNDKVGAYPNEDFNSIDPAQINEVMDYMISLQLPQPAAPAPTVQRDVTKPEQMTPEERGILGHQEVIDSAKRDYELAKTGQTWGFSGGQSYKTKAAAVKDTKALLDKISTPTESDIKRGASDHYGEVNKAVESKLPVSAAAVDAYGITLPEGYVRQGDLYVFQPSGTVEVATDEAETYTQFRNRIERENAEEFQGLTASEKSDILDDFADLGQWGEALVKRAETEQLSDEVLDDYVDRFGLDTYAIRFRGKAEQRQYVPKLVRQQPGKESLDVRTRGQKAADTRKAREKAPAKPAPQPKPAAEVETPVAGVLSAEEAPDRLMDVPQAMQFLYGKGLTKTDREKAQKLLEKNEREARKTGKLQGARSFYESEIDAAVEEVLAQKQTSADFRRTLEWAKANKEANQELLDLVNALDVAEATLKEIESDRGMFGVQWAEKNVRRRATMQKAKIRDLKTRIVAIAPTKNFGSTNTVVTKEAKDQAEEAPIVEELTPEEENTAAEVDQAIDDAIESTLTLEEKQEAAAELGEPSWSPTALAKFSQAMGEWSTQATTFSARLVSLFKKVLKASRQAILAATLALGSINTTTEGSVEQAAPRAELTAPKSLAPKLTGITAEGYFASALVAKPTIFGGLTPWALSQKPPLKAAQNNLDGYGVTALPRVSSQGDETVLNLNDAGPVKIRKSPFDQAKDAAKKIKGDVLMAVLPKRAAKHFLNKGSVEHVDALAEMLYEKESTSPKIAKMLRSMGVSQSPDTFPWCATSASYALTRGGAPVSIQSARAFLNFGKAKQTPKYGDIVVMWNTNPDTGGKNGWGGHVGFYLGEVDGAIAVLSGNVNDEVNVSLFSKDRVLGYREVPAKGTKMTSVKETSQAAIPLFIAGAVRRRKKKAAEGFGSTNTVVTKEAKDQAAKSLRESLGQTNVGLNPATLKYAITVGTYYLEGGVRSFADFSAKMVEEFGEGVRKYLQPAYEALRKRTDIDTTGMDPVEGVETAPVVEAPTAPAAAPAARVEAETPKAAPTQAAPKPVPAPSQEPDVVGITNARVKAQRERLNLEELNTLVGEAYSFPQMWADSESALKADPTRGSALVKELNEKPRSLKPLEVAILLREEVVRTNALNQAMEEFNAAPSGNNEVERQRMDEAVVALTEVDNAAKVSGTEQGRALNARKLLAKLDYTLPKMLTTLSAANNGSLKDGDLEVVTRLQKRLKDVQDQLAEVESGQADRIAEAEKIAFEAGRQAVLKDIEERAKADAAKVAEMQKRKAEYLAAKKEAAKTPSKWEEIRAAARARNAELRSNLYSDVVLVKAASMAVNDVIIGATYIAEGVTKFADWVSKMRSEDINLTDDEMQQLFKESKAFDAGEDLPASEAPLKVKKAKAPAIDKVKAIAADEEALDSRTVYNLVVEKMKKRAEESKAAKLPEMSADDLTSVISEVTADVKEFFPDITEREIRDLFSGYGKILMPSKEELAKQIRQLSALGKLQSAIEDAEAKRAPLKSGPQRDKATQAIRLQQKKLARELRMMGRDYEAGEEQLRSPLDAIKARLNNQIDDLAMEINTRKKAPRRPSVDYDKDTQELADLRDELKRISDFINAPAGPTFTELVNEEMKKLDARIAELQKTLAEGKFSPKEDTALYTQELQVKRDERDRLSKLVAEARKKAIGDTRTQDEIDRVAVSEAKKAIAELERKIADKDLKRPENRTPTETADYKALIDEKKRLQGVLSKMRQEAEGRQGMTDEQRIKQATAAIDKSIERMQKMLTSGNYDVPKRTSKTPETPELAQKRETRDKLRKQLLELRKLKRDALIDPIAKQLKTDKKRIQTRMDKLKKRMETGDFSKPEKRKKATDDELLALQVEEENLKEAWAKMVFERQLASRGPGKRLLDAGQQTLNTARAVLTSFDVSAVLRQGGFIVLGNPLRGFRNLGPMFQAFGSDKFAKEEKFRLERRENFKNGAYQQSKLFLADVNKVDQMTQQEEAFMSRWIKKLPKGAKGLYIGSAIQGSQRAYTVFLNRLRMDTFDAMVANLKKGSEPTPQEMSAVANYINIATGRGDLGKFNQAGTMLNTVFFAPRLVASRFQILAGYPYFTASGRTKALVLREYGKFFAGATLVYVIGALAQGDDDEPIETDPRSSDFLKIRFGDTRVDPLSGLIQATVLVSRLVSGEKKQASGKIVPIRGEKVPYGADDSFDVMGNFVRTKFSPIVGSAVNVVTGKNVVGEPTDIGEETKRMLIPMSFTEMKETLEAQGVPEATALIMLQLFGMGVQTYTPGKK